MDRLLSKDPRTRLSLEAALTHPWIKRPTPIGMHGLAGDSFMSQESLDTTVVEGNGTTNAGTEVPPTGQVSPQSSMSGFGATGSAAQLGFGSTAALSAAPSDEYSQPFSQLALDHSRQAPPAALVPQPGSRFSSDGGSGFVGGSWAPANGGGGMVIDTHPNNGDGSSANGNGHLPQPYTLAAPPAPVYHPPIARRRPPLPEPATPSHAQPGPEPTPKRKRSSSPAPAETPESVNGHGLHERAMRDQTVLGSPAVASASSSLSDAPASPRAEMMEPINPPPPAAMEVSPTQASQSKIKGQSFSSPVKRSARIRDRQAPSSATKQTPQRTPGGNSGRNVRRKTDSPVESSILANGNGAGTPASTNAPRTRTRSAATGARRKSSRIA